MGDRENVCRYEKGNGMTIDVIIEADGDWKICQYTRLSNPTHTVRAQFLSGRDTAKYDERIPDRMELTGHGVFEYKLVLDLLDSVCLSNGNKKSEP